MGIYNTLNKNYFSLFFYFYHVLKSKKIQLLKFQVLLLMALANFGYATDVDSRIATASSSLSSAPSPATATVEKISSLDALPSLLDKAMTKRYYVAGELIREIPLRIFPPVLGQVIAGYGVEECTRILFLDFDDCIAGRKYTVQTADGDDAVTYEFSLISSLERRRQLESALQRIVAEAFGIDGKDNEGKDDNTWEFVSQVPNAPHDSIKLYAYIGSTRCTYQPVSNISTIITTLKARKFVVKVCSGIQADPSRLAVLGQIGLAKEDYLDASVKGKVATMLECISDMREESGDKKNNYLAVHVDNYFPDAQEKTGRSPNELAARMSEEVTEINGMDTGVVSLKVDSLFVNDMRLENAFNAHKTDVKREIEQSFRVRLELLSLLKIQQEEFLELNRQSTKVAKFKIKKLRQKLAKTGLITDKKQKKTRRADLKGKLSRAKSAKENLKDDVSTEEAQSLIIDANQRTAELSKLLADFRRLAKERA